MKKSKIHKLIKTCPQCNIEYKVRSPSEILTRVYCSKKCQIDAIRKEKTQIKCEICQKDIFVPPCLAPTTKYCSVKCKGIGTRKIKENGIRQCNKCQEILVISCFSKNEYICKSCRCKISRKRARTPRGRYKASQSIAKSRNLEWEISEVQYYELIKQKCHYCYYPLNETGIGLDRMDNDKGYLINNVVPCCLPCNRTRSDNYSYNEMLILAETIRQIKKTRV